MRRLRIWLAMKLLPRDAEVGNGLEIDGMIRLARDGAVLRNCTFTNATPYSHRVEIAP